MDLACIQFSPTPGAIEKNLDAAEEAVIETAREGADLIVLPEQFAVGFFAFDAYRESAEPIGGRIHDRFATVADRLDVAILVGSIVEDLAATNSTGPIDTPASKGLANTSVMYDASGQRQAIYRKTHLWGYDSREASLLVPGESLGVATIQDLSVGIVTCYDLRFPELFRALLNRGVELILVPSAWPFPRVEHWRTLSRARAIENLAYVATANGTGNMAGERLCGRSTIYDPWGTLLSSAGDDPGHIMATIDRDQVRQIRNDFPALKDRRQNADWLPDGHQ